MSIQSVLEKAERDIARLAEERKVTPEMMNVPMDATLLSIRRSEWRSLSEEAQAKLMQITGATHPDELRRRDQAAEDLSSTRLVNSEL